MARARGHGEDLPTFMCSGSLFLGKHVGFQDFCNRFNESMGWETEAEFTIIQ